MNKKLILLPLSALLVFMMAGLASAAVTCTFDQTATTVGTPSSYLRPTSDNGGNQANLSATAIGQSGGQNVTDGELTNDVTSTLYVYNSTTVDLGQFLDTQLVTFTWTLKNVSKDTVATCTRAYIVDIDKPDCSFASGLVSNDNYKPTQKWTVSCGNASSATLRFGNNNLLSMVESSDSCTFTGTKSNVPEGSYATLTASTSDGLNTTSCSLSNIRIDSGAPLKEVAVIIATQDKARKAAESQSAGTGGNNIVIIAIIGLAAWWYVKGKKGK